MVKTSVLPSDWNHMPYKEKRDWFIFGTDEIKDAAGHNSYMNIKQTSRKIEILSVKDDAPQEVKREYEELLELEKEARAQGLLIDC